MVLFYSNEHSASRRDPFGRLGRSGASLDALRRLYQSGRSDTASKSLQDDVGMDRRNNEDDVATVELLLDRQKIYDMSKTDGPTGIFSVGLQEAIKTFQKERGLKVDGYLRPEGETIKRLNQEKEEESEDNADSSKDQCRTFEAVYKNALSNYRNWENEFKSFQKKLESEQSNLRNVNRQIEFLKSGEREAAVASEVIGRVGGGMAAGLLALATKNPRAVVGATVIGQDRGGDIADAARKGDKNRLLLLEKERQEIIKNVDSLVKHIDSYITPEFMQARQVKDDAYQMYQACKN